MKDLDHQSKTIYLKDYKAPDFLIDHVDLSFELDEEKTRVVSILQLKRQAFSESSPLVLSGECLELGEVKIDNALIDDSSYK